MRDKQLPTVMMTEIIEQRPKGWPDFHPEDYCHRYGPHLDTRGGECGGHPRSAGAKMSADPFDEIRHITESLRPPAFFARIDLWRRGGIAGNGMNERVGCSPTSKLPAFDRTDVKLNEVEAEYREHLQGVSVAMHSDPRDEREALRLLRKAQRLEELWLKPIVTPDKEMAKELGRLVSDAQSCLTCGDTKDAFVRRMKKLGHKTPLWKLRGGDCGKCWQDKRRAALEASPPDAAVAS